MTYFEKIVNIETGEEIERAYTAKEIKEVEMAKAIAIEREAELAAKAAEKAALLNRLGLTEDELKTILG